MEAPKQILEVAELATRRADALDVALYWVRGTIETYVTVEDHRSGEQFRIDVPEGTNPNEVFEHPYAYHDSRATE